MLSWSDPQARIIREPHCILVYFDFWNHRIGIRPLKVNLLCEKQIHHDTHDTKHSQVTQYRTQQRNCHCLYFHILHILQPGKIRLLIICSTAAVIRVGRRGGAPVARLATGAALTRSAFARTVGSWAFLLPLRALAALHGKWKAKLKMN